MACPAPFLPEARYPPLGGDVGARACTGIPVEGYPMCCLPCPRQQWVYPDNFLTLITGSTYLNLAGVACCLFLLLSFAALSVEYTNRHYMSVCLVVAIMVLQMSFVIPMGEKNGQCYDAITPHDMYSSITCALSGAFLLGGAWCVAIWIFLRTLSLHLQICWQMVPGRKFFLASQAIGWSLPVVFLAIVLSITGVSFRFGDSCHINTKDSLKTFWGPLLATAACSVVAQLVTFCYCVRVYIKSLLDDNTQGITTLDTPLPYANSVRTVTPRQAFRRIKRVIALSWRGIMVVTVIIADVIFFSVIFLQFEDVSEKTPENTKSAIIWLNCILANNGDKNMCLHQASKLAIPETTALAVIYLLSFNGVWALLLIGRFSMLVGWWNLVKTWFGTKPINDEFVSYNARRISEQERSYEMLGSRKAEKTQSCEISSPPTGMLTLPPIIIQPSLPKPYLPSRSSMLSSSFSFSDTEKPCSNKNNVQFSSSTSIGATTAPDIEEDFHHALSPKPPSAPYHMK